MDTVKLPVSTPLTFSLKETRKTTVSELVGLRGGSWRAMNGLGVAYGMAGRYADAMEAFRRGLKAYPKSETTRANLARAQRGLERAGVELLGLNAAEGF